MVAIRVLGVEAAVLTVNGKLHCWGFDQQTPDVYAGFLGQCRGRLTLIQPKCQVFVYNYQNYRNVSLLCTLMLLLIYIYVYYRLLFVYMKIICHRKMI